MQLQFVGCGDAFGSGGRFNTCFHLVGQSINALIDCGATSAVAMNRLAIDRNAIDIIFISHFHADHIGGLPFFMLESNYVLKRQRPLVVAGPPGLRTRFPELMEAAFPGTKALALSFPLTLQELEIGCRNTVGPAVATPFHVVHDDRAGPCLGLRIETEGKVVAYSGDTEWTDALIEVGRGADLFICEAYTENKAIRTHMALSLLERHLDAIAPKRLVLTHMSAAMLAQRPKLSFETAEDGMIIKI